MALFIQHVISVSNGLFRENIDQLLFLVLLSTLGYVWQPTLLHHKYDTAQDSLLLVSKLRLRGFERPISKTRSIPQAPGLLLIENSWTCKPFTRWLVVLPLAAYQEGAPLRPRPLLQTGPILIAKCMMTKKRSARSQYSSCLPPGASEFTPDERKTCPCRRDLTSLTRNMKRSGVRQNHHRRVVFAPSREVVV